MTLLHDMFDATAEAQPSLPALRHGGREFSYAEVDAQSRCLAAGLLESGIRSGDRIVVHQANRPQTVFVALACSRVGAICVPANPMLKQRQLRHILVDSGARALFTSARCAPVAMAAVAETPLPQQVVLCEESGGVEGAVRFADLLMEGNVAAPSIDDGAPAALLYTSGSTGKPKGVIVSHRNLVAGAESVAAYLGNRPDDRILAALPLSFDYGFSQVTTAIAAGACAVLTNYSMASSLMHEIANEHITGLAGVPTMWIQLAALDWPQAAVESLRYLTTSGGTIPGSTIDLLETRLPHTRVFCMYGLTEAFRSTYLEPEALAERRGSIGKAVPGQDVLVLREDGSECAPGEVGELVHRGSFVTLGYWNDKTRTQQRFRPLPDQDAGSSDIAVWSGDLVRADEDGYLYFVGRNDDLIKSLGYRISASEVEEAVLEVPGVVEAVAVGITDPDAGQRVAVAIVVASTAGPDPQDAVRRHCRMQLPLHMVPVQIRCVAEIPRNLNGKYDRQSLRGEFASSASRAAAPRSHDGLTAAARFSDNRISAKR